jgi:hypothetical protein
LGVIPADNDTLFDAVAAADSGHRHLAAWLGDVEAKWVANCAKDAEGAPRITLLRQLDHMHKLSAQLNAVGLKVVYTKAGTFLSAAILEQGLLDRCSEQRGGRIFNSYPQ